MEINFEDIITKANARKEVLKQIMEVVESGAQDAFEAAMTVKAFQENMGRCYAKLDPEGRALLPASVRIFCDYGTNTHWIDGTLYRVVNGGSTGLEQLHRAVAESTR